MSDVLEFYYFSSFDILESIIICVLLFYFQYNNDLISLLS